MSSPKMPAWEATYMREFKLSHSNLVNRIIKITCSHNLRMKMLDCTLCT